MHFDATQRTILDFYAHAAVRNASPQTKKRKKAVVNVDAQAGKQQARSRESRSAVTHRKIKLEPFVSCASSPYAFQWAFVYFRSRLLFYFACCVLCTSSARVSTYENVDVLASAKSAPTHSVFNEAPSLSCFLHYRHTYTICVRVGSRSMLFSPEFSHSVDD